MAPFAKYLLQLGKNIKAARAQSGLKQIEVHQQIGLAYRHYQSIEAGKVNVTIETLYRLAQLFKVDVQELVRDTRPSEAPSLEQVP